MIFNEGSDGSILEGFGGVFYVTIDANNIMIKRNLIYGITILANHKPDKSNMKKYQIILTFEKFFLPKIFLVYDFIKFFYNVI